MKELDGGSMKTRFFFFLVGRNGEEDENEDEG